MTAAGTEREGLPTGPGPSHRPSLRTLAERGLREAAPLARGDVILCACSGGPDSTALLHVLAMLAPRLGHRVVAHGVDHGLRAEAPAELGLAAAAAARVGVPFGLSRVEVAPGANLQARARVARFDALRAASRQTGARIVATGHTADDRAETVLLRLLRGAGPRGLGVLPPRAPWPASLPPGASLDGPAPALVRPLLRARRSDVLAHLRRHRLAFAEDPSNGDPRFLRVRVRRDLLPLLTELSPGIVAHLCALADSLGGALPDALAGLGRAQRQAIEHARRGGRASVRLRVQGGHELEVTFPDDEIVLNEGR